ncbi:MAG: hypothetical protein IJD33_02395 [Clostridia bacterium]|nr:hypothetical protein [Clostridia bacterium]
MRKVHGSCRNVENAINPKETADEKQTTALYDIEGNEKTSKIGANEVLWK